MVNEIEGGIRDLLDLVEAQRREIAKLREAIRPFSNFAGIVFARNFDNTDPVDTMTDEDGTKATLFASDYFAARAAFAKTGENDVQPKP